MKIHFSDEEFRGLMNQIDSLKMATGELKEKAESWKRDIQNSKEALARINAKMEYNKNCLSMLEKISDQFPCG